MSVNYQVSLQDCQLNQQNVWNNIKSVDKLNKLDLMALIIQSYYKLYPEKTPHDLEKELRDNNLNVGLIAVKWDKLEQYTELIKQNKGLILKKASIPKYKGTQFNSSLDVDPCDLSKYVTFISCRPRDLVIEETLSHHKTMENNLEKLVEAGDFVGFSDDDQTNNDDQKNNDDQVYKNIQAGTKLIVLHEMDFEKIFNQLQQEYKSAEVKLVGNYQNKEIYGLVSDNQIISPIVYYFNDNQKIFIQLPQNKTL